MRVATWTLKNPERQGFRRVETWEGSGRYYWTLTIGRRYFLAYFKRRATPNQVDAATSHSDGAHEG